MCWTDGGRRGTDVIHRTLIDLLQIENSRSFRLAAGREYSKFAIPNGGLARRHAVALTGKKIMLVFGWNNALELGRKLALKWKNRRKYILVFLFKRLKVQWTDALSLFFLIGIDVICKKNFRKTFQRLLGRKPRRFCDQLTFSIIQVFAHFLEFLKIRQKMFPFFR